MKVSVWHGEGPLITFIENSAALKRTPPAYACHRATQLIGPLSHFILPVYGSLD